MNRSETIASIGLALAKAQGEMQSAKFDSTNPFLKNKYASLGSVIEAARPALAKNELAISQHPVTNEAGEIGVETILIHSSGEWLSSALYLGAGDEKGKSSAQVLGSIITYLRRYALASILGVYADDDTDGNDGKQPANGKPAQAQKAAPPPPAEPAPAPVLKSLMTPDMAATVTNRDGMPYTDIDSETLSHMSRSIAKSMNNKTMTPEERADLEFKQDAIAVILQARNNGG